MATTIRIGVFETNSSSSHSLVIGFENNISGDIEILNGTLNVSDLENFVIKGGYYDDSEFILCDTKNKKLALAFAIILNKLENDEWNKNTYYHDLFENLKDQYEIIEVIGEYNNAWDEGEQLQELINVIDTSIVVQSKYESN